MRLALTRKNLLKMREPIAFPRLLREMRLRTHPGVRSLTATAFVLILDFSLLYSSRQMAIDLRTALQKVLTVDS
jgi:hypothetical protein